MLIYYFGTQEIHMSAGALLVRAPLVTVLMLSFNEEEQLGASVTGMSRLCSEGGLAHEIVVVDNGSVDNTAGLLALLRHSVLALRVSSLPKRRGQGEVIRSGLQLAKGRYVLLSGVSDARRALSQDVRSSFEKALQLLGDGYELVITEAAPVEDSNLRGFGIALVGRLKKGMDVFLGGRGEAPLLFMERERALSLSLQLRDSQGIPDLVALARDRKYRIAEVVRPNTER